MYNSLLVSHSLFRWVVLISLIFSVFWAFRGWKTEKVFTKIDHRIRFWMVTVSHIQLTLGLFLYYYSPIVSYFIQNFDKALKEREIRFFGMEHNFSMIIAVVLITLGSMKAKKKETDVEKFKTIAIWFFIALVIILGNIPWEFSPLVSRPSFRSFSY